MSGILSGRDPSRVVEGDPLMSRVHVPLKKRGPRPRRLNCKMCGGRGMRLRGNFQHDCKHCGGTGNDPES